MPHQLPAGRGLTMAILLAASFMNLLDTSIVNVALPSISREIGASAGDLEWIVAGYIVAFALSLLPGGRMGDVFGHKRIFMIGVAVFTLASVACGLAAESKTLIIARLIQGIGGGMMVPQVPAIARLVFEAEDRTKAFAMISQVTGIASVAGPIIGGALIAADIAGLGWRTVFLINLPIGVLALGLGVRHLPQLPHAENERIDWGGILIAAIAMLALIVPLIEGPSFDWPAWSIVLLVCSPLVFGSLYIWLRRRRSRGLSQLLPIALLHDKDYMLCVVMALLHYTTVTSFFVVLALYFQTGFGQTPFASGLYTTSYSVGVFIAATYSRRLGSQALRGRILAGMGLSFAGMIALMFVVGLAPASFSAWGFVLPLFAAGCGLGLAIAPLFQISLSRVSDDDAGSGSGALQAFQQVGGATGVAIVGLIFHQRLEAALAAGASIGVAHSKGLISVLVYNAIAFIVVSLLVLFVHKQKSEAPAAMSGSGA